MTDVRVVEGSSTNFEEVFIFIASCKVQRRRQGKQRENGDEREYALHSDDDPSPFSGFFFFSLS